MLLVIQVFLTSNITLHTNPKSKNITGVPHKKPPVKLRDNTAIVPANAFITSSAYVKLRSLNPCTMLLNPIILGNDEEVEAAVWRTRAWSVSWTDLVSVVGR